MEEEEKKLAVAKAGNEKSAFKSGVMDKQHSSSASKASGEISQSARHRSAADIDAGESVHCLLCQCKMSLHPALINGGEGGENAVVGHFSSPSPSSSSSDFQGKELNRKKMEACSLPGCSFEDTRSAIGGAGDDDSASTLPLISDPIGNCNLLELISKTKSPFDVPMCKKCATSVAAELQKQLEEMEKECLQYKQTLDELTLHRAECPFDQDAASKKLEMLKAEELDLLEQLSFLEQEENTLSKELETKIQAKRQINERDEELYRQLRDNHRTLIEQADEQRSLKLQIKNNEEQLKRLCQTNMMDLVFHIWVDGEFGTISGFRLGRLRHEQIEWNEINAALGQMAFLLKVIAERLGMEFVGYELVPFGNSSFIRSRKETPDRVEELPLYGTGGWRPFGQPALDKGLIAFMDFFIQVEQHLKQHFPHGTQLLPYRMLKDKIVDKDSQYLVKMQLNSQERWTKAMKCLLLNMKRVIGILNTLPTIIAQKQQQQQNSPQ